MLEIIRDRVTPYSIGGKLAIEGVFECFTLERPYSDPDFKPIPEGQYEVKLLMSPRFQEIIPHILNVPGREAIEIHMGNHVTDSHGCVLVGKQRGQDVIFSSVVALNELIAVLEKMHNTIYIDIKGVTNEATT